MDGLAPLFPNPRAPRRRCHHRQLHQGDVLEQDFKKASSPGNDPRWLRLMWWLWSLGWRRMNLRPCDLLNPSSLRRQGGEIVYYCKKTPTFTCFSVVEVKEFAAKRRSPQSLRRSRCIQIFLLNSPQDSKRPGKNRDLTLACGRFSWTQKLARSSGPHDGQPVK